MIGIYKITSPVGKIYIGQSINIEKRIKEYKKLRNCNNQRKLFNSLLKHGEINHVYDIIEECEIPSLNERERYWQDYYDSSSKNRLNIRLTKSNDKTGVSKCSEKTKILISKANKGKIVSDHTRKKMSESRKGIVPWNKGTGKIYKHNCYVCGNDFSSRHSYSKLCSKYCRNKNLNKNGISLKNSWNINNEK